MTDAKLFSLAELPPRDPSERSRGTSDELAPGSYPNIDDLTQSLIFSPDSGEIWLSGQRMVLMHNTGLGRLRHELIENIGLARTRGIMQRTGFHCGASDAVQLRQRFSDAEALALFAAGPVMHGFEGAVKVEVQRFEFDMAKGVYYGDFLWHNSFEDDEHIALFGIGTEAACWMLLGYAMGYTSTLTGKMIIYREVECRAMGAKVCRVIGKPADEWENVEEDLALLNAETFNQQTGSSTDTQAPTRQQKAAASINEKSAPSNGETDMVGVSSAFSVACHLLRRVAPTSASVLFTGESGVGKEMFARMLHRVSPRQNRPFIAVNCAAIPETLMESELFGVERGAFTGATQSRPGRFERADGGTLFLDEIGTLSLVAQGKLLRALQESEVERVGGTHTLKVDVRLVAATNVDLRDAVSRGEFREDLFFRLNVFPIHLPPLRERREDVPLLMSHFLQRFNVLHGKQIKGFTPRAVDTLLAYGFPGNIRELQNFVERGVINAHDNEVIDLSHLLTSGERLNQPVFSVGTQGTLSFHGGNQQRRGDSLPSRTTSSHNALKTLIENAQDHELTLQGLETLLIDQTLESVKGNVSEAARRLGLTRAQLSYRISRRSDGEGPTQK
ncbi:sigma-54-dependent Fis family transcriptional regulator [Pseudomonas sp. G5(2012)]|uniref:sigma-54-dependent Fis family transcriptional regulator n=1 Tax=Pseudomonas sp. G5(2012) TaxID=1268068 RepID=UPI000343282B|nr:sigma-54-dependent Fis family transcriptional regulator [Pseudomonas sp. G5(2012)]EPA99349.1 sigma-54 dependent transcription regulator [Pseudomonas sp. G5(2012)]